MKVAIRVKPGAKRTKVGGCWSAPSGDALVVAVAARAVEGKANTAVVAAIADAFGLRSSAVRLVHGEKGRDKIVELDPAEISDADASAVLAGLLGPDATVAQ